MIKVLIAEDEKIIREGIKRSIEWDSLGFIVVGEAEDGEEAWDMIETLSPDVLITDVQMPFLNGIELQKKIKDKNLNLFTIVISGYNDFEYARDMLNNGAFAYLLKPLKIEELKQKLLEIKKEFSIQIKNEAEMGLLKKTVQKGKKQSIEYNAYLFINDICSYEETRYKLEMMGINSDAMMFIGVIIKIDKSLYIINDIDEEIKRINKKCLKPKMMFWDSKTSKDYTLIIWDDNGCNLIKEFDNYINSFKEQIKCNVYFSKPIVVKGLIELKKIIKGLEKEEKIETNNGFSVLSNADAINMAEKVNIDSISSIEKSISEIKKKAIDGKWDYYEMRFIVSIIVYNLYKKIETANYDSSLFFENTPNSIVSDLMHNDYGELDALSEWLKTLKITLDEYERSEKNVISSKAKRFINAHYTEEDLCLNDVANYVNMSMSYFSVVFKKEVGISFSEYLLNIRMEKACDLLKTGNYKAYEVAELVGYSNATYFSTQFKRKFGISPSDFKNKRMK